VHLLKLAHGVFRTFGLDQHSRQIIAVPQVVGALRNRLLHGPECRFDFAPTGVAQRQVIPDGGVVRLDRTRSLVDF